MSKSNAAGGDIDDLLGSGSEEAIYKTSYQQGFDEGSLEGSVEGWKFGLKTGADVGFELGKYKGFAIAVQEDLTIRKQLAAVELSTGEHIVGESGRESSQSHRKSLKLCEKIIELVDEFKLEKVISVHDACSQVRAQYNLLRNNLGITEATEIGKETISGQKYSF